MFAKPQIQMLISAKIWILAMALLTGGSALAGDLVWNAGGDGAWDWSAANWTGDATIFSDGDNVLFDDPAGGTITVETGVMPLSTMVDADAGTTVMLVESVSNSPGDMIAGGILVKDGPGTLILGDDALPPFGTNTFSNGFTEVLINAGTVKYRGIRAFGPASTVVTLAGGTTLIQEKQEGNVPQFDVKNPFVLAGGMVNVPMDFGIYKDVWLSGVISGAGGLSISGNTRSLTLTGDNSFAGGVDFQGSNPRLQILTYTALGTGTLTVGQTSSSGDGAGLLARGSLGGDGNHPDGVTNDIVILSGRYFNVSGDAASHSLLLSGMISGEGILRKHRNDSTVTLSGENTYTGGTVVEMGMLICASADSLGGGPLSIGTAGTLKLDFIGTRSVASLTVDGGAPLLDGTYGSSDSPASNKDDQHFSGTGTVRVGPPKDPTTTALVLSEGNNPAGVGTPLTFTATVTGGPLSGDVTFYDGLTTLGTVPLDGSSQASITVSTLSKGTHSITAQYPGDEDHASSTSDPIILSVIDERPPTTIALTLTSGTNPSEYGDSVTFIATVAGDADPTGEVAFYDRDILIGASVLNDAFQASITTSVLPSGLRGIMAFYAGDANNADSATPAPYIQSVNPPPGDGKLKVFILAGQSNMQGYGKLEVGRNPDNPMGPEIEDGLGCLRNAVARNPLKYGHLEDPDNPVDGKPGWITRDDVWISYWDGMNGDPNAVTVERRAGYLDAGFGVHATLEAELIGPEYGFGLTVGSALADKVLIIKVAWGGKSLAVDFRPPGSGGETGPFYTTMVSKIHEVIDNLESFYPGYDGGGYEIAGFGWHQGWNDRIDAGHTAEYEANLANLIRDVRADLEAPAMPFVIANSGMADAPSGPGSLIAAQGAVSDPEKYPEFAGNVVTVDTRPFDYGEFQSPNQFGYHWYWNGESYFNIGESMGLAMLSMGTTGSGVNVFTGDVNSDGTINLADAVSLLTYLFVNKNDPGIACLKSADANNDGGLNLADAIKILSYQFTGDTLEAPDGAMLGSVDAGGEKPAGCYEYATEQVADLGCETPCR